MGISRGRELNGPEECQKCSGHPDVLRLSEGSGWMGGTGGKESFHLLCYWPSKTRKQKRKFIAEPDKHSPHFLSPRFHLDKHPSALARQEIRFLFWMTLVSRPAVVVESSQSCWRTQSRLRGTNQFKPFYEVFLQFFRIEVSFHHRDIQRQGAGKACQTR